MSRLNVLTPEDVNFCKQFGTLLKTKRKELKLSQQKVANKTGISRQVIQTWEAGKTRISLKNTLKLIDSGIITFEAIDFGIKDRGILNEIVG
ncbi:MAG: helix-turn-helix transcriptional regulator [Pseudoalteromonas sp.]|uniref:helix-turn-helix domain-containing protein n=1 Tax=Pseudoalteromonas sp. TaxID=53249 RepID=UPI001D627CE2|nr:helix-turn-helix transcriptional regulator [Pseudoalteromonas sp.]NRA76834.1 helix-turn-helix transcriptional regulator [Pseudoalteromonas sp.]